MSLINEMLRDLEHRRKREEHCVPNDDTPVVVGEEVASPRFIFFGGTILLLSGLIWVGMKIIPGVLSVELATPDLSGSHQVVPTVVEAADRVPVPSVDASENSSREIPVSMVSALVEDSSPTVSERFSAELLSLGVVETEKNAQLSLAFAQLPEYRLLQNGIGVAQLVISFNQTQLGDNFEIPPLEGTLLKRVSLVPQKQTLQLLVDLDDRATVQSFQLVDDSDQEYRFLIEIAATALVVEKQQEQLPTPEPDPVIVETTKDPVVARVSKNPNQLSHDQQVYQAGLDQLKQGHLAAAEEHFSQALRINPELLDARLHLVTLLQQRMELDKAESFLQQGLSLIPGSSDLRKIYARLLLNDQRQGQGITLLKTEPVPEVSQDPEYHALLAALLQESDQFVNANSIYGQLVQVFPQEPLWWMGMAISFEHLENPEHARGAYQKALNLPGLRPDLQSYIQSRLQVL